MRRSNVFWGQTPASITGCACDALMIRVACQYPKRIIGYAYDTLGVRLGYACPKRWSVPHFFFFVANMAGAYPGYAGYALELTMFNLTVSFEAFRLRVLAWAF